MFLLTPDNSFRHLEDERARDFCRLFVTKRILEKKKKKKKIKVCLN